MSEESKDKTEQPLSGPFVTFATTTTIKGIPKVLNSDTQFLRFLWLCCVVIGLSVSIYLIYGILDSYFSYQTTMVIHEKMVNPEFPDVTVCKTNPAPRIKPKVRYITIIIGVSHYT